MPGFVVFRFDARDPGERLVQVCHVRAGASGELCSAWRGQGFESVLYGVDAPDELRGVRRGDDPFDLLAFAGQDESRSSRGPVLLVELLEPLPRGARLVVDAPRPPVAGAGPADGLLGRGEQVGLDAHQLP